MDIKTERIKRAYKKKVKEPVIEAPVPVPTPVPDVVKDPDEEISKLFKDMAIYSFDAIAIYIYYKGTNIDTLLYIQEFQNILISRSIGSQIIIDACGEHVERIKLHNAFITESELSNWKGMYYSVKPTPCIFINVLERPSVNPDTLYNQLLNNTYETSGTLIVEVI